LLKYLSKNLLKYKKKKLNLLWWKLLKLKLEILFSNIICYNIKLKIKNILSVFSKKRRKLFKKHYINTNIKLWYFRKFKHIKDTINLINISAYLGNSQLLANQISKEFRFNKQHKRFIFIINDIVKSLNLYRFLNNKIKIGIKGKIHGNPRSKQFFLLKNFLLSRQTINNTYSYTLRHCLTKFGVFGIKVWIFKNGKLLKFKNLK
jgi:hypothetical protein